MSATLPILQAIQQHLSQALPDWSVELLPDKPDQYYLAHPNGAILIGYLGSSFEALRATDIVSQTRTVQLTLTVISRNLHNDIGALAVLDQLRLLLVGFKPPNCTECYLMQERFDGEESGVWQYQLVVQTDTMQVQKVQALAAPHLVKIIPQQQR